MCAGFDGLRSGCLSRVALVPSGSICPYGLLFRPYNNYIGTSSRPKPKYLLRGHMSALANVGAKALNASSLIGLRL